MPYRSLTLPLSGASRTDDVMQLAALRSTCRVVLDDGGFESGWLTGPMVAIDPRAVNGDPDRWVDPVEALAGLGRRIERRRGGGGPRTGIVVALAYEFAGPARSGVAGLPRAMLLEVDRSVTRVAEDRVELAVRAADESEADRQLDRLTIELGRPAALVPADPARVTRRPRTSLARDRYIEAAAAVGRHIACGDIYQGNLCQMFEAPYQGDPYELFRVLTAAVPAPHAAFVGDGRIALASVSPETFLRASTPGRIETWPIKGTRPRGDTPGDDRRAAQELLDSEKDAAELLMIVDLERNDLSRVCRAGSVHVDPLRRLVSFATVHHLVAGVHGALRPGTGLGELISAAFPGGSITGAPKRRAMEILAGLEPAPRSFFTGSLFWFGDDGRLDSSILIRTLIFDPRFVRLGAGGGVVADSDPEDEWRESNHKARALAGALGFRPEEAI